MRSGGWERSARDARSVPVVDTGASVVGPGRGASCRSWSRRWSTPASARPRRSASPPSTRPTGTSPRGSSASRLPRSRRGGGGATAPPRRPRSTGAREAKRYRANDFSISRQRSWGTPIPVVHCEACGAVPVPEADLPVVLPRDIKPTGEGNPLAERPDFVDVECPALRRRRQARDRHPRLPLRRALALGSGRGAARGSRRADVRPPRPAGVAAGRAPGRRRRQRRLRLRPAHRHQGAARHRPLRLHRGRRAVRRLPLPRDGDRRRPQDEQAPRQRRQPRRAGRAVRRRHGPARRSSTPPARRRR